MTNNKPFWAFLSALMKAKLMTNKHGGVRLGAGAPKKENVVRNRTIRLSDGDWLKLQLLGGAKWLRDQLAKIPKE